MQQKLASGNKRRYWNEKPKCHFCRRVFDKGEEIIVMGNDYTRDMHRTCLDNWLHAHPPIAGASSKIQSAVEVEEEFKRLQRRLKRQLRTKAQAKEATKAKRTAKT